MRRLFSDITKVILLMGLVGYGLYSFDDSNVVVFQALGIGVFLIGGTHLTRRILFHRLDLQSIALKAVNEKNLAAAVVFTVICWVVVSITQLSMQVLK